MTRTDPIRAGRAARAVSSGLALLAGVLLAAAAAAQPELDGQRAAWQYRRAVTVPAGAQGFAALPLPPEVGARSQPGLEDLRLLGGDGAEVPYVVDRREERRRRERTDGTLTDTSSERHVRTLWIVDLQAQRRFDTVELTVREADFAKRVTIEAGDDGRSWRTLREGAGIFDQRWSPGAGRLHQTTVALPAPESARYLRITAQDARSTPVTVEGAAVLLERSVPEERWTLAAVLSPAPTSAGRGTSRFRIDVPPGLPIEALALEAQDQAFARRVSLVEEPLQSGGEGRRVVRGTGVLFRLHLRDAEVDGESLDLPVERPGGGPLYVEIDDGDSPPLRGVRLVLSGTASRLIFPVMQSGGGGLTIYYGNPATRAASYDLEVLKEALSRHESFAAAAAGPEGRNARYQPAPPLQVVMSPGAIMQIERWRFMRPLQVPGREDLYGLVLEPADLGALREDLGDLRISDAEGRQVPYVLEMATPPRRLALRVEREPGKDRVSRYRLRPDVPAGQLAAALPLLAVELDVAEGVFSRPARLRDPAADERQPALAGEVLARREGALPLRLAVPPGRYHELVLEIDDGDNAPLTVRSAWGVGRLPRLAFKHRPEIGSCRLFLGNATVEAPRYDIEALRQQVLDYTAVPASAGPLQANFAYRPRAGDYVRSAPPAMILWATLLITIAAMLLLTARLIRKH